MISDPTPRTAAQEKEMVIALCEAMAVRPVSGPLSAVEETAARAAFTTIADAVRADLHVFLAELTAAGLSA